MHQHFHPHHKGVHRKATARRNKAPQTMKVYIQEKITTYFLPVFILLMALPHVFTYIDAMINDRDVVPRVIDKESTEFFTSAKLSAGSIATSFNQTIRDLAVIEKMFQETYGLYASGNQNTTSFDSVENVCNYLNSSSCQISNVETFYTVSKLKQIFNRLDTKISLSIISYYNEDPFTAQSWEYFMSVKSLETYFAYYFLDQSLWQFMYSGLVFYLQDSSVHMVYPGSNIDANNIPVINSEGTLNARLSLVSDENPTELLARTSMVTIPSSKDTNQFFLARALRTSQNPGSYVGYVAAAIPSSILSGLITSNYSRCENGKNMIITVDGDILVTQTTSSNQTYSNIKDLGLPTAILDSTSAFLQNYKTAEYLNFSMLNSSNSSKSNSYSVYAEQIHILGLMEPDTLFYASFCHHSELDNLLDYFLSFQISLHIIFAIVDLVCLIGILFLIRYWAKYFDNLVMNPIRQMSEKLHRILKSAYVSSINPKKITPDDILIKENTEIKQLHKELCNVCKTIMEDKSFLVEGDILDKTNLYINKRYKKRYDDNIMRGLRLLAETIENSVQTRRASVVLHSSRLGTYSDKYDEALKSARRPSENINIQLQQFKP